MPTPSPLATIDLADPGFRADPYPVYARLRREAPVVRNEAMGYWLLSRYPGDLTVFPGRGTRRPDQMIRGYLRLPARFTDGPR